MKKLLAVILALCMICSLLPVYAIGEELFEAGELELDELFTEEPVLELPDEEELIPEEPADEPVIEEVPELPEGITLEEVMPEELEEVAALEAGDFPINTTTVPDDSLRALILANYDYTHDNILKGDEWATITVFYIPTDVVDAKGIEAFQNLKSLSSNAKATDTGSLKYIDVSKNTKLTSINIAYNKVESLDVSQNTALVQLYCTDNKLTSLDVSNNAQLNTLYCSTNSLSSLDVSNNAALKTLYCANNKLTSLDISNNPGLTTLYCTNNNLSSLDVSNNTLLATLYCAGNTITSLDISNNTKLVNLVCYNMSTLTDLDISNCPTLVQAYSDGKKFVNNTYHYNYFTTDKTATASDVSSNPSLINLAVDQTLNVTATIAPPPTPVPPPTPAPDTTGIRGYVIRCYNNILDRNGDESGDQGQDFWTKEIAEGRQTGASIVSVFINSAEFTSKGYGNKEIIETIYLAMLGHKPDEAGLKYWLALLNQGLSYNAIINGFASSAEFLAICGEYGIIPGSVPVEPRDMNPPVTAFIVRCYKYALNRDRALGQVTDSELNGWVGALLSGTRTAQQVAYEFATSKELFDETKDKDELFIRRLYALYMDRDADEDPAGRDYWVLRLKEGLTRGGVASAFGGSPEFIGIVQSYGLGIT